jgi:hypothetical protein
MTFPLIDELKKLEALASKDWSVYKLKVYAGNALYSLGIFKSRNDAKLAIAARNANPKLIAAIEKMIVALDFVASYGPGSHSAQLALAEVRKILGEER